MYLKNVGPLLVESVIALQEIQMELGKLKDNGIGVSVNEVEHKLHKVIDILEKGD